MKRVLVCGSNGLLGQHLALLFHRTPGTEVLHTSRQRSFILSGMMADYTQLDLEVRGDVKSLVTSYRPDVIVNAAAMSNVDACETERESAWRANVTAVEHLVEAARRIGAKLVHLSTDYVFDGRTGSYGEGDRPNPVNYYGRTKLAGENAVLAGGVPYAILRTQLLYGVGVNVKSDFGLWAVRQLRSGAVIRCADDQICNPTAVTDLAAAVRTAALGEASGVFHVSGPEPLSRYGFALIAAGVFGYDASLITKVRSADLVQKAVRPLNTSFSIAKARAALDYHPMTAAQGLEEMRRELTGISLN